MKFRARTIEPFPVPRYQNPFIKIEVLVILTKRVFIPEAALEFRNRAWPRIVAFPCIEMLHTFPHNTIKIRSMVQRKNAVEAIESKTFITKSIMIPPMPAGDAAPVRPGC